MLTINTMEEAIDDFLGTKFDRDTPSSPEYLDLVQNARRQVYVVAGNLNTQFYSGPFVESLRNALDKSFYLKVNILAHLGVRGSESEAIRKLSQENKPLIKLLSSKFDGNRENIQFFWAENYPRYHFAIVDSSVYLEGLHKPGEPRETYLRKDERFSEEYISHFNRMSSGVDVHKIPIPLKS